MAVQSYHIIWDTPLVTDSLYLENCTTHRYPQTHFCLSMHLACWPAIHCCGWTSGPCHTTGAVVTILEIRFSWLPLSNIFLPSLVLVFLPLGDETYQTKRVGEVWQEATTFTICQESRSHCGQICYNTLAPSRAHTEMETSDKCCRQFLFTGTSFVHFFCISPYLLLLEKR